MKELNTDEELQKFIQDKSFPCVMAKALLKKGFLCLHKEQKADAETAKNVLERFHQFVDAYRSKPDRLSSFILTFDDARYESFENFEKDFWSFLNLLSSLDKQLFPHDPRVSADPKDSKYGYSIKSEAFFILLLHPKSPRFARRFFKPSIVFNPHQQFENLRKEGLFSRVRNIIRSKDKILQGTINPMLKDFGERSEIFQYTGKNYPTELDLPMSQGALA